jgi:hypothetical protein
MPKANPRGWTLPKEELGAIEPRGELVPPQE